MNYLKFKKDSVREIKSIKMAEILTTLKGIIIVVLIFSGLIYACSHMPYTIYKVYIPDNNGNIYLKYSSICPEIKKLDSLRFTISGKSDAGLDWFIVCNYKYIDLFKTEIFKTT